MPITFWSVGMSKDVAAATVLRTMAESHMSSQSHSLEKYLDPTQSRYESRGWIPQSYMIMLTLCLRSLLTRS